MIKLKITNENAVEVPILTMEEMDEMEMDIYDNCEMTVGKLFRGLE